MYIYLFFKKIVIIVIGPVIMCITLKKKEEDSLSTCGQTVYNIVLVMHSIHI